MVFAFVMPVANVKAASPLLMRVLVLEASKLRIRSDSKGFFVRGAGLGRQKLRAINLQEKDGLMHLQIDGRLGSSIPLESKSLLSIRSNDSRGIWLGKRRYRGELKVRLSSNGLQVINYLGLEDYLASVVGSEMPKSWPLEALKAQAVAARTYALQRVRKSSFYDIKSTQKSQVYLGLEAETKSTRKAVQRTRSLVMFHRGKLINAVFHSSAGGATEASGDVWKNQFPYLVSVPAYDHQSPSNSWELRFDPQKLRLAFKEINGLKDIKILKVSPTGRVRLARVYGFDGTLDLSGKELRRRLGLKSTLVSFKTNTLDQEVTSTYKSNLFSDLSSKSMTKDGESVPSLIQRMNNLWIVDSEGKPINDVDIPPLTIPPPAMKLVAPPKPYIGPKSKQGHVVLIANGSGAGHGVGMSQWGAYGMAQKGASFRQILFHYYRGVQILPYQ